MSERLRGKRIAIFAEDLFEESELLEPMHFLRGEGAHVSLIGSGRAGEFRGKNGVLVEADYDADEIEATDFDAYVIPGGYAPDKMRQSEAMIDLIARADDAGKVIAAICHGPQLLISADVLRGRMVTCFRTIAVDVKNAGAHYVDEAVVVDGNLVTSRRPDDIPQFNEAIADCLVSTDPAVRHPIVAGA